MIFTNKGYTRNFKPLRVEKSKGSLPSTWQLLLSQSPQRIHGVKHSLESKRRVRRQKGFSVHMGTSKSQGAWVQVPPVTYC